MPALVVLGAGGFLGKAILEHATNFLSIKAIVRKKPSNTSLYSERITWHEIDLLTPHSLDEILEKDDIVINATYITTDCEHENLLLIDNIIASCVKKEVKRFIHCSTADVVGAVKTVHIDESVDCNPMTKYERVKFSIEQRILTNRIDKIEAVIVRPSAIVGPEGKNLVKLADSLINGNQFINYLRASFFKNRKMNLVPLHNVSGAILHLSNLENIVNGSIYFISSDNDLENNFIDVERILRRSLGLNNRKIPLLPIPLFFLSTLLKLKGRSESTISRIYRSNKLQSSNFIPIDSLTNAIKQFGKAYLKAKNQ